jgi:hypothetical protein
VSGSDGTVSYVVPAATRRRRPQVQLGSCVWRQLRAGDLRTLRAPVGSRTKALGYIAGGICPQDRARSHGATSPTDPQTEKLSTIGTGARFARRARGGSRRSGPPPR